MNRHDPCRQVKSVLSKLLLCRTATLKGRLHRCRTCGTEVNVYNSCGDRHCPQCGGARRADWLDKTERLLLPGVSYFQLVFTLPSTLSALALGNRRQLYGLLFSAAWQALEGELRRSGQFQPAALMVLHTWNQELDHHPHLHALVPGGSPSRDGRRWAVPRHPRQSRRPWLTDRDQLAAAFRRHYISGLRRLLERGELRLADSQLDDEDRREAWLKSLEAKSWNVYIEGPPRGESRPEHVLKYLARYMTGGPISAGRLIAVTQGRVEFWARSRDRANRSRPFGLPGHEFARRWSLHILPRGFTKTRRYGGYHPQKQQAYLEQCRSLLDIGEPQPVAADPPESSLPAPKCSKCERELELVSDEPRPSWRQVFTELVYQDATSYCPLPHLGPPSRSRAPPSPSHSSSPRP